MRTVWASIVVSIGLVSGQENPGFASLITDEDGSTLGFVLDGLKSKQPNTWTLKLAGTTLRWTEAPVRIARLSRNGTRILTSRNWTTLGRRPNCSGGSSCITAVFHSTHNVADNLTGQSLWSGTNASVWMNESGQDIVWRSQDGGPLYITELQQGGTRVLTDEKFTFMYRLADGSFFVYDAQRSGYLTLDGKFEPTAYISLLNPSVVSGDGSRLFYWQGTSLRVRTIRTGEDREIFQSARPTWAVWSSSVAVSRDGNVVLLTQPNELTGKEDLIALTGGNRIVLVENESAMQSALSSDGKVAFCATAHGRILRITIDSFALQTNFFSSTTELVSRTPRIRYVFPAAAGSQTTLIGTGLSDLTAEAPPNSKWRDELGGVAIQAQNLRFPIGFVSPTVIRAQIPFELGPVPEDGKFVAIEMPPDNSPFVGEPVLRISPTGPILLNENQLVDSSLAYVNRPLVYRDTEPRQLLEKQDSGLGPVRPNERLHFLVTGLGPTSPPMETGMPPPPDSPRLAIYPIRCTLEQSIEDPGAIEVPVEFAGLEPGMVGIYRITVRLPEKPWGYLRFPGFGLRLIP